MAYQPPSGDWPISVRVGNENRQFTSQLELGRFLKESYRISSLQHMTSCGICHR
jgi:hypothetical protein